MVRELEACCLTERTGNCLSHVSCVVSNVTNATDQLALEPEAQELPWMPYPLPPTSSETPSLPVRHLVFRSDHRPLRYLSAQPTAASSLPGARAAPAHAHSPPRQQTPHACCMLRSRHGATATNTGKVPAPWIFCSRGRDRQQRNKNTESVRWW